MKDNMTLIGTIKIDRVGFKKEYDDMRESLLASGMSESEVEDRIQKMESSPLEIWCEYNGTEEDKNFIEFVRRALSEESENVRKQQ